MTSGSPWRRQSSRRAASRGSSGDLAAAITKSTDASAAAASRVIWSGWPEPIPMILIRRVTGRPQLNRVSLPVLDVALELEVDLLHGGDDLGVRFLPQLSLGGLVQSLDDAAQRPGVCVLHELRSDERRVGKECVHTCRFRW